MIVPVVFFFSLGNTLLDSRILFTMILTIILPFLIVLTICVFRRGVLGFAYLQTSANFSMQIFGFDNQSLLDGFEINFYF